MKEIDNDSEGENMKECSVCCLPETQDGITFDEQGKCNVCEQIEIKKHVVDWEKRKEALEKLCDKFRGKSTYDCIVPFSGGKDSTYQLWYLVEVLKMKPLVFSYDHGFYRPLHLENRERTLKKIGVDFLTFKSNWKIVRELMLESLKRKGDFCWHCHCGIYSGAMQMAVKFKIPLIFWGQPNAEYDSYGYSYEEIEVVDEKQYNRYINLGITAEDMIGMLPDWVQMRDLDIFRFPKLEELRELGVVSVRLGSYIPWDPRTIADDIQEKLGWKFTEVEGIPGEYGWEKIECMFTGIRDYLKYIKRGFGRTTFLVSIDIREKRKNKQKALELIKEFDGKRPASMDLFLELLDISEDEFMEIMLKHCVSPYKHDPSKTKKGEPLGDQEQWKSLLGINK